MSPGERIKQVRIERELSQSGFATALGFPLYKVRDIERGHQKTTLEIATKIGEIFYINPQWIMTGEGEMSFPVTGASRERLSSSESSHQSVELTPEELEMIRIARECPEAISVVRLMGEMDRDAQKAIQARAEEKKLLQDLMKERLERKAG